MNCDGDVDFDDIDAFTTALSGQATYEAAYPDCRWLNADCDGDGDVDFDDIDAFTALSGTGDGMSVQYTWDAENRLIGVEPLATPADGDLKSVYTRHDMNRRLRVLRQRLRQHRPSRDPGRRDGEHREEPLE